MRITLIKCLVCVVVTFLWSHARADDTVFCVFMESCTLPCSFQAGDDPLIHWIQVTYRNIPVHSYYHNQDQIRNQDLRFRGRTSMFKDQISRGNASLQLTDVAVQDQGRYKCHSSTSSDKKESFIKVNVDAPVHTVDIKQVDNRITCSSDGIYPKPGLTWSINPPSSMSLQNETTVQTTAQQLYNISSSLTLSDSITEMTYSCTISTRSNRKTTNYTISGSSVDKGMQNHKRTVIGRVVGVVFLAVVITILAVLYICVRSKQKKKNRAHTTQTNQPAPVSEGSILLKDISKNGDGSKEPEPDEEINPSTQERRTT